MQTSGKVASRIGKVAPGRKSTNEFVRRNMDYVKRQAASAGPQGGLINGVMRRKRGRRG